MLDSPDQDAGPATGHLAAVLAILEATAAAHRARDATALERLYAPDARLADLAPPLTRRGFDVARHQAWLDGWDGPVELEFRDLAVAGSGGLALVDGLMRTAARRDGAEVVWWSRLSAALTLGPEGWRIAHEHVSTPFHMDGSFRAALDLFPEGDKERAMTTETTDAPTQTRPSPDVMRGVIPYIGLGGRASEAADFYARAFAARDLGRMPAEDEPSKLMHCQIEINGGALMLTDMTAPGETPVAPQGFHLQLVVANGDAWWRRAVEAGCEVIMPFELMFWGDRWGMLRDPFGLQWAIDEPGEAG